MSGKYGNARKTAFLTLILCFGLLFGVFGQAMAATTLRVGVWATAPETRQFLEEELMPEFERQNPGVKVEIMWLDVSKINEQLMAAFAAGMAPDLFQGGIMTFPALYGSQGTVMNLNKYVENWPGKDNFYDSAWRAGIYKGNVYGLTVSLDVRPLWYRKDFFVEAGLDPETPPTTWEELREMAIKLTKRQGSTITRAGYWVPTTSFDSMQSGWLPFLFQQGLGLLNETQTAVGFDNPKGIEAITFYHDLLWKDHVDVLGGVPAAVQTVPVITGTAAMATSGSGVTMRDMMRYAPEKFDQLGAAPPTAREQRATFFGGTTLMMNSKTENPDLAWKLMELWAQPENLTKYAVADNQLPPLKNVKDDPVFADPRWRVALETIEYGHPWPGSPKHGEYRMKFVAMSEAIMQNITPIEKAIRETAEEVNAMLSNK